MVPEIDYLLPAADRRQAMVEACESLGFFQLLNSPLTPALQSGAMALADAFFSRSTAEKRELLRTLERPWGFYDAELTKNLRDRKEIFDFSLNEPVLWPDSPAGFERYFVDYARACHALSLELLDDLGTALDGPSLSGSFSGRHSSYLRLNYYPTPDNLVEEGAPAAGPLGISRHTDAGALTVLLQDQVAGLQMYDGAWRDVTPIPGALTINVGDMLQVWSNDRFTAPLHRVKASDSAERFSIAYFLNPDYDCTVVPRAAAGVPPRYRPIDWREFRGVRAQGDYGDYGEEVQISHYQTTNATTQPVAGGD